MSTWRKKAIELLPSCRTEFERPDATIYTIFIYVLPELVERHQRNDKEGIQKIYDFAEWCFSQKPKDLWNAAGVSFYEHLCDYPETLHAFTKYIKPSIYRDVRGLLELRMQADELKKLDDYYSPEVNSKQYHSNRKANKHGKKII